MKNKMIKQTAMALSIAIGCSGNVWAGEDSDLRRTGVHYGEDGWDVGLGLGVGSGSEGGIYIDDDPDASVVILGGITYRKGRFFLAAEEDNGFEIGYSLIQKQDWVVDAVFGPAFGAYFEGNSKLEHLDDRDIDGQLGLRYSLYGDHNRISLGLSQDVIDAHDGWVASAEYLHEWQFKNWLVTGSAGLAHISDKMANHMVGVSANEATAAIPAYTPDAGNIAWFGVKTEYPVTEKWVFQARADTRVLDDEFEDSPITENDTNAVSSLVVGMKYQF